jgi:hypothetical protein
MSRLVVVVLGTHAAALIDHFGGVLCAAAGTDMDGKKRISPRLKKAINLSPSSLNSNL